MKPVILCAAVTGNKWTREDTPYIPQTIEEIISHSLDAVEAGASILHIHARDLNAGPNGKTHDPKFFKPLLDAFRKECPEVVLEMSVGFMEGEVDKCLEPLLALKPDFASFNLKGSDEETELMFKLFAKYQVRPVFELFNLNMLQRVMEYRNKGYFSGPVCFNLVFDLEDCGQSMTAYAKQMIDLVSGLPDDCEWFATRGGSCALDISSMAVALGGGIRTGLEDSIYMKEGVYAENSAQLISRAKHLAEAMGKTIATPSETKSRIL